VGAAIAVAALLLPLLVAASAGAAAPRGQFVLRCVYSHTLPDDPIVAPGQPGASHSHDFYGNTTVNADSTMESMLAGGTTCRVPSDTAGYWAPTAYLNGEQVRPTVMRIYYLGTPNAEVETIPAGLQMIGGNRDATSGLENPHVRWYCGETKDVKTPRASVPYDCTDYARQHAFVDGVIAIVDFPNCWDGVGLTPSSVVYPESGNCPAGFRHVLPRLSERVHLGIMDPTVPGPDSTVALELSSGPYWTFHADFWNTWQQERLDQLVEECIVAEVHCGAVDASGRIDWTRQFGTRRYDLAWATATHADGAYVAGFTNFALEGQRYRHRYDAFVRKYGAGGKELWTRQFGSSGVDQVLAISADEGGVTVVGSTDGRLPKQEAVGGLDLFAARFGPRGRQLWVRQLGTKGDDRATAVVTVPGGAYVAGSTTGRLGGDRRGVTDAFLLHLDADGDVVWVRQFGTDRAEEVTGLAARAGRLYAVGWTAGTLRGRFVGGATDGFVAVYGVGGDARWRRQVGTTGADRLSAVVARADGLFLSGSTDGAFEDQANAGGLDAFVGKLAPLGRPLWFRQFGSPSDDDAVALGADGKGVYVAGSTSGALPDGEHLGEWDGFVRKYLPNGTQIWTRQLGTDDFDQVYGLSVEPTGLYVTGTTHGSFEGFENAGDRDVFVIRVAFS
jgi:hypothetical protein